MTSPRFRLLPTTADLELYAWGSTEKELFEHAAAGLFSAMASIPAVEVKVRRQVSASAGDLEGLLVAWLSEWLYLFDTEGFIGKTFTVEKIGGGRIAGGAGGEIYRPGIHTLRAGVKGVTYHRLEIVPAGDRLRARLVLDI